MAHDDLWQKLQKEFTKPSPLVITIGVILLILIAVLLYTYFFNNKRRYRSRGPMFATSM